MHMADALVSTAVSGTMYVASAAAAGYSLKKLNKEIKEREELRKIPVMGVMGAFIFATQMLNFTIPGTGSSGHLCGGMLASAILGPYAGFVTMIGVLLLQCLLFADGGILALGANIWNMAFYGCFVGALLIWKPIMKNGASKKKIIIASMLGCILTLQMGAFSVVLQTSASKITQLPFSVFVGLMQPIHLAIGAVEGLITSAVLCFIYEARPEMLWGVEGKSTNEGRLSWKKTLVILAVVAIIFAGVVSLFASSNPDGLEWSLEKITGSTELEYEDKAHETAGNIQDSTALLPDYAFSDENASETLGTSFSGIIGAAIIVAVAGCASFVLKKKK